MIQIVSEYKSFTSEFKSLIKKSHYKLGYFIEQLKISRPTFYRKLNNNTFTIKEVEIVTKILFPREVFLAEMKEGIERGRDDVNKGNVINANKYLDDLEKRFL